MGTSRLRPSQRVWATVALLLALVIAASACGGSDPEPGVEAPQTNESVPGIVNLDDADLLIEDLRVDPEIRAELSIELADQLDISSADADCLAGRIDVEDLLAMSESDPDDGALERILEAFDACDVPRSVFDQ